MHNKISHMLRIEKCHYKKLKQQIIKCLICFPSPNIIQPSLHFLHQGTYFVWALDIPTHFINFHEIYGSICELECTFGFD